MSLFSINLSEEFQSFLIVEALSAAIGTDIGVMKLHSGRTFVSVLGYRVSQFLDGVFIGKICTHTTAAGVKKSGGFSPEKRSLVRALRVRLYSPTQHTRLMVRVWDRSDLPQK